MGQGLGGRQRQILQELHARGPLYATELVWSFAEQIDPRFKVGAPNQAPANLEIPASIYVGVRVALDALEGRGLIVRQARRVTSLDELALVYPHRTKKLRERFARVHLLPPLFAFAKSNPRRFERADNEEHALAGLRPRKRHEMQAQWRAANRCLGRLEADSQDDVLRDALFELRIRGEQLFGSARVKHLAAFETLLEDVRRAATTAERTVVDGTVAPALGFFPPQAVDGATMKSVLHAAVSTTQRETVRLQPEAGWELVQRAAPVLQALGMQHTRVHQLGISRGLEAVHAAISDRRGPHLGWLSKRLIARDAFARFDFVALM